MADITLTRAQQTAVDDRSGTLLVAAAAGSGKTAILTRRLITRLCSPDEDGDISEFLVVTFTKAATGELRARLYKALSEYVASNPGNKRARRQLSLIGLAKISTIHSFCLDIIKSNFEALALPSVLRMGEETEVNVLLNSTLDRIISEHYDNADDGSLFLKAVEILSGAKSDADFSKSLLDLYKKLRGLAGYEEKCLTYLEKYTEVIQCSEIFETGFGKLILEDIDYEVGRVISDLECILAQAELYEDAYNVLHDALLKDCDALEKIRNVLHDGYNAVREAAAGFSAARCKNIPKECECREYIDELKNHRTKCIDRIRTLIKKYLGASSDTVKLAAGEAFDVLSEIFSIIKELDREFSEKKLERGILDFSDLEQYTLKLLVADTGEISGNFVRTALAEDISGNFREIYIDEYQDTNSVQDMIFRAVSKYDEKLGTECNRFLVGDLKQSIYRFRGAQPEIFSSYIKLFSDVGADNAKDVTEHKLYLSNNFRCSENVINATNRVFGVIMDEYREEDSLIYSKEEQNKVTSPCELVLLNCLSDEDETNDEKYDEEAMYIAKRILEMAYNPAYLNEEGKMYTFSNFAVLQRSANSLSDAYRRAFRKMKVPFSCDTPEDFFALSEVLLALCLFNCVDNPQRDIYTAGLMYSPLYGFTADEMVEIRSCNRRTSFFSCVTEYSETAEDCELLTKVRAFLEEISDFRKKSRGTPTDILISEMFERTGIYDIYSALPEKRRNIRKLYDMARTFERTSFRGLSAFLEYINNLAQGSSDSRPEAEVDSVKFMSIHRSKGLEFPVVFIAGMTREFNTSDEKTPIIFSSRHGIGIKLRDTADNGITESKRNISSINTPFREAVRSSERQEMLEEEKRLLYVAMTRARDRLIMTVATKKLQNTIINADIRRNGGFEAYGKYAMSYFDFIYHSLSDREFAALQSCDIKDADDCFLCYRVDLSGDYFSDNAKGGIGSEAVSVDAEKVKVYADILKDADSGVGYPVILSGISAKISVSQLKKGLLDEDEVSKMRPAVKALPKFMADVSEADGAEKGTAAHIFMQFADYGNLEENGAAAEADRLLAKGFITKRMRSILELDILDGFIRSGLYSDIKKAGKLYRERRFNLRLPVSEFTDKLPEGSDGDFILVQGVSDLYFENPDGTLTLVDFKTDRVRENDGEEILKARHTEQLGYYKRAIEEITRKRVSKVYVYSFALSREILLDI